MWRVVAIFCLFLSLSSLSLVSHAVSVDETIAPVRDIVITDTSKEPEWKGLWDKARELTRQKKYVEAALAYAQLLVLKENIEEASWEYGLVLIALADWEQAGIIMESLLSKAPQRTDYLLSAGLVALKKKEFARAATYYQSVYKRQAELDGQQVIEALDGLVAAFQGQGKDELAFPLMEQLYQHRPDDRILLQQLASHASTTSRFSVPGRREKAVLYYEKLVSQPKVEDLILLEAAMAFERCGQEDKAVPCWEKYLQRYPDYQLFQEKLADYLLKRGEKEAALPHLLILLAQGELKTDRHDHLLQQVGAIYLFDLQRPDKALPYYEELFRRRPENQGVVQEIAKIQDMLAQDMASRVGQEGAEAIWKKLAPVSPSRLAIYSSMVQSLEKNGNSKELRGALAVIHQHDPENQGVILRLAELFLEQHDLKQAEYFLGVLLPEICKEGGQKSRCLLANAQLAEQQGTLKAALVWYHRYLEVVPSDSAIRRHSLEVSAQLGWIAFYEEQYHFLRREAPSEREQLAMDLQYARVLLTNGLATKSKNLCQELMATRLGDDAFRAEIRLVLAKALHGEGNVFEAEQVLRKMVVDGADDAKILVTVLYQLVEFSLQSKDAELAWAWGTVLSEYAGDSLTLATYAQDGRNLSLLRARVLVMAGIMAGKLNQAIDTLQSYRDFLVQQRLSGSSALAMKYQADLLLAHLYLQDRQYDQAQTLIETLMKEHPFDKEPVVLARQLVDTGTTSKLRNPLGDNMSASSTDDTFLSLIQISQLEQRYGDSNAALKHARMALQKEPDSLLARNAEAHLLRALGDLDGAVLALHSLVVDYPQELGFARQLLEVEFQQASFQQIIATLIPSWPPSAEKTIMAFPDTTHLAVWQKLILARSLWADHQWVAAIAIYNALLQPAVELLFTEKMAEKQAQLVLPPPKQSFWNLISLTRPAEPDRLTVAMAPAFVMDRTQGAAASTGAEVGVDLYALFRWQGLVAEELSARRTLAQGDYYQAMKEYQDMVDKSPSPESLFDLAGIYSRLGLLGKEALIYEEMEKKSPHYPELAEAVSRNDLKRKPKAMLDGGYSSASGRDGYQDIQQTRGGGSAWMMPSLRQDLETSWSIIHATSQLTDQTLWRNRFLATYAFSPHSHLDFISRIGAEKPSANKPDEDDPRVYYDMTPLYHLEIRGRIGDELQGFARLRQDVVEDTVQALEQGISMRDMEGGLSLDILPRLLGGGEYRFREYSDANHQNRYFVWASYILHSEPTLLQVSYGQELQHNSDNNKGRNFLLENGFSPGDHPYWSPHEYWQNQVSVHFKHQLAADALGRSTPSYYTLEYSLGYEEGEYDNHRFGGEIFLEMSRHFLVSSNFDILQGGQEIRKDIGLSLIYRF